MRKKKTELIDVTIIGEERVKYHQTVKMSREEYNRLDAMLNSRNRDEEQKAQEQIREYIDVDEILDSEDFEVEDFKLGDC